jgi:ABC-2 type transport system permease protein
MASRSADTTFQYFRSPQTAVARFVAKRTFKSAALWAFIFGIYAISKVIGFVKAYKTPAAREALTHSLNNNAGINALIGTPHQIGTVNGYANWVVLGTITLIASVWALLLATKYFRGDEEAGRTELLLTGRTTARQATINTFLGLSSSLVFMYLLVSVMFIVIGKVQGVGYNTQNALFFALASVCSATLFLAIGAFTSQLMPTRTRASTTAAVIFGLSFILRAIADSTSARWLLTATPLGWVERLQPLVGSRPIWLLPIFGSALLLCLATVWLAGRRDLGESVFADHDTAKPRTKLLGSPTGLAFRLTRASTIGWFVAVVAMSWLYGSLTKTIVQAVSGSQSKSVTKALHKITQSSHLGIATIFLGAMFLIMMAVVMAYVASATGKAREDEAEGYVDNFLVQPIGRLQWLGGRVLLIALFSLVICLGTSLGFWAGVASVHLGVPIHLLLEAGANMAAPVLFTLGASILALGFIPRLTTVVAYSVLGWSFMVTLIASGTNISHWVLDTSILHQVTLAPAANPNWTVDAVLVGIGIVLCLLGMLRFNYRDLQNE